MMASLKLALLLLIGLHSSALTMAFNVEDVQKVPDAPTARQLMDSLEQLCDRLPGPSGAAKTCREQVEKMLPLAITFLTGAVKPGQVCTILGLCDSHSYDKQEGLLTSHVQEGLKAAMVIQELRTTTQCTFCKLLIKTIESMLPKERTETAIIEVLEKVCVILPPSYRDKCEALIDSFGKTLLDALLSHATPQAICTLIRMCKGQEALPMEKAPLDPCTLRSYMCRDFKTALKCRTMSFCHRFAWKALSYNPL